MIWFHGGSNVTGSTGDDIPFLQPPTLFYNGRGLVEGANVVVVTANYRLGSTCAQPMAPRSPTCSDRSGPT
jgi:carboxylesterase type B